MNKTELVEVMYEKLGGTKKAAEDAVDLMFNTVADALKDGKEVSIAGFGVFFVKQRAARKGRNPRTGEAVEVPAMKTPKFRPGKPLKEKVR